MAGVTEWEAKNSMQEVPGFPGEEAESRRNVALKEIVSPAQEGQPVLR